MELLLPITAVLAGFVFVVGIGSSVRWLFAPLLVGITARLLMAVVHSYVQPLPQGQADARVFDATALQWSQEGCLAFFHHADPSGSYVYSAILASIYGCFGYSELAAQFLNGVLGTLSVAAFGLAAKAAWGVSTGSRVAFLVAVYPTLIIYSAVTLRESMILALFALGVFALVRYAISGRSVIWALISAAFFILAAAFHGAMLFAAMAVFVVLAYQKMMTVGRGRQAGLGRALSLSIGTLILSASMAFVMDGLLIPKVGVVGELDTESVGAVLASRAQGDAAYLQGLSVSSPLDIIWQAPLRIAYLLFSPFPWSISSPSHLFGLLDGAFNLFVAVQVFRHRRALVRHPAFWPLIIVVAALALLFAFGTSNFGTAMRHRAKFYLAILVVLGPYLTMLSRRPLRKDL